MKRDWFEDEAFWRELYPYIFGHQRFAAAEDEARAIVRLTGQRRGRVLDLCCGPGRHSLAFAKRGFRVTGVDRTKFFLGKARQFARAAGLPVEWVHCDMRDFVRPEGFELALSLYNSFGYFEQPQADRVVLGQVCRSLAPGGVFVMDLLGKECLARTFTPVSVVDFPDGAVLIERREVSRHWTRLRNEWLLVRGDRVRRYRYQHTLYSGQELQDRLLEAGFAKVQICGGFDGREYSVDTPRLVIVARKP